MILKNIPYFPFSSFSQVNNLAEASLIW